MDEHSFSPEEEDSISVEMIMDDEVDEIIDDMADVGSVSLDENDSDNQMGDSMVKDDAVQVFKSSPSSTHSVFCCSFNKNGELAVMGDENDMAYVWDTNTGKVILVCNNHTDSVIFAEFSHKDEYLITVDMGGKILVWLMKDKTLFGEAYMNCSNCSWITWHNSADILLSGSEDGLVYRYKVPHGSVEVYAQGSGDQTESGIFLPNGNHAAIGYNSGIIRIIDLNENTVLSTLRAHPKHGHSSSVLTLDCQNNLLISASLNGEILLSTINNSKIVQHLNFVKTKMRTSVKNTLYFVSVESVVFCKDPTFPVIAIGTIDDDSLGSLYIWDHSNQILRHEITQEGGITKVVWTSSSILFTGGVNGMVNCYDAKTGCCLKTFSGHTSAILDLCLSKDEKKMLTVSDDSTARIFDISSIT